MPVTTRSSTRPSAPVVPSHNYHLRNERPSAGFYTELTAEDMAAAETLVSMRSSGAAPATRRSPRIAQRS